MPILPMLMLVLADPTPGPLKGFGDWVVACDNQKSCEMTSLMPGDGMSDPGEEYGNVMVSISRAAGKQAGLSVDIMMQVPKTELIRLSIGGVPVAEGRTVNDSLTLKGAAAQKLVAAMVAGDELFISDSADTMIARASLKGSSAALRFIDDQQGRAGTVTAAVAKGAKPASAVPDQTALPVIRQVKPAGTAARITPALQKAMNTASECGVEYEDMAQQQVETGALGSGATLALLPCGAGAYNYLTVPFVITAGKPVLARFDFSPGMSEKDSPVPMLVNADWDAKTGRLSSYSKGRGLGDCGSSETYVWDGTRFRLTGAAQMHECRGSVNWLTVWKAEAE